MKALLLACCVLLSACAKPADPPEPADPPGPALLFAAGHGDLSAEERLQVFNNLAFTVTPDGKG